MTNSLANWFLISYRQSRLLGVLVLVINNIYAISQSPNFPGKQLWRGAWLEDRGHLLLAPLLCYLFNIESQSSFSFKDVNADWLTIHVMWPSVWCPNPSERRRMDERVGWRERKVERNDVIKRREKKGLRIALQICYIPYLIWHILSQASVLAAPIDGGCQINWVGITIITTLSLWGCGGLYEGRLPAIASE